MLLLIVLLIIIVTTAIKILVYEVRRKDSHSYHHLTNEEEARLKYPRSQSGKEVEIRFDLTPFDSGRFKVLFSLKIT